jgi:hypothetical protein
MSRSETPIEGLIKELTKEYAKDGYTVSSINHGMCEEFAEEICRRLSGAEAFWGDELATEQDAEDEALMDELRYHKVVKFEGRYYDSEHPEGVDDFRTMSTFKDPQWA